jgi:catechol 2,3-dioxygenase-like lactoylglutathione lyase family enzyme
MSNPNLKITGIAVVFMVQNLERTRRFYADALGLELAEKEGYLLGTLPAGTALALSRRGPAAPPLAKGRPVSDALPALPDVCSKHPCV